MKETHKLMYQVKCIQIVCKRAATKLYEVDTLFSKEKWTTVEIHNRPFFFALIISSRIEVRDEPSSSRTSFFPSREGLSSRSLPF